MDRKETCRRVVFVAGPNYIRRPSDQTRERHNDGACRQTDVISNSHERDNSGNLDECRFSP